MANSPTIREKGSDGIEFTATTPASQPGDVFPAGVMLFFAGTAAPTGWLVCDGSIVSRATYPNLFAAIGTTYGVGDGSTTFGIPDSRGKVPVSKHSSGTFNTLGATGGVETVTLDVTQIPSHNHGSVTDSQSPSTGFESNDHTHQMSNDFLANSFVSPTGFVQGGAGSFIQRLNAPSSGGRSAAHTHTVNAHAHAISLQGGGLSHSNLQPYIVFNHIIRAY